MSINASCDYLNETAWPRPPYFTYSAISWLAPSSKTVYDVLQKCCGGRAYPLLSYENDCLVWCETDDYWYKVLACVNEHDLIDRDIIGHAHLGNTKGIYIKDSQQAPIMFPEEPDPPFLPEELRPPYKSCHQTRVLKIDYCMPEDDLDAKAAAERAVWLDDWVESTRLALFNAACENEKKRKQRRVDEARGWFRGWVFQNESVMQEARDMKMRSCRLLHEIESRMVRLPFVNQESNWVGLMLFIIVCSKILGVW